MKYILLSLLLAYASCTSIILPAPTPVVEDFSIIRNKMLKCLTETNEVSQVLKDYAKKMLESNKNEPLNFSKLNLGPDDRMNIKACWKVAGTSKKKLRNLEEKTEKFEQILGAFNPSGIVDCLKYAQDIFSVIRKASATWKSADYTTAIQIIVNNIEKGIDTFNYCKNAIFPPE